MANQRKLAPGVVALPRGLLSFDAMSPTYPAIVPASGRSLRMGKPKALLDAGDGTFMSRILGSLSEGGAGPILVVVRDLQDPVAEAAGKGGGTVVLNPDPTPGPIASLQAGLRALGTETEADAVLFAPVDHPLFAPETVAALIRTFRETRAPLVIPAFEGWRGHPVLFSRRLFPELLEDDLPEGARSVVRRYLDERVQVEVEDPGILADIDTPEEYRKHFRRSP